MDYSDLEPNVDSVPINTTTVPLIIGAVREYLEEGCFECAAVNLFWGYDRKGYLHIGPVHQKVNSYQECGSDQVILDIKISVSRDSILDGGWGASSSIAKLHKQQVNILTVRDYQKSLEDKQAKLDQIAELEKKIEELKKEV